MSGWIILTAALAVQTPTATGTTVPTETTTGPKVGQLTYLDVEGGVGYSTNPLLSVFDDEDSAFGRISLHAVHTRISSRSTTLLSGYAENVSYLSHHGSQQSLDFYARHDTAVSEKLRLYGDLDASYQKGGQLDARIVGLPDVPPLPGTPGTPPELLPPGSDFLSVTGKEYRLAANVGGQLSLSANDALNFSTGVDRVVFRSAGTDTSYTTIPVSIGYNRQISARTTIGGRVSAQDTEYNGPSSLRMITPQVTATTLLSERLTLSGALGVSFASVDDGLDTSHSTGLAAEADLCSRTERSRFCARAAVDQQTATVAGPSKSISGGIDYSRELDANSTLQLSVDANHYSSPISVVTGQQFSNATYFRAAGAYTRHLGHRWFGGVNLSARKLSEDGPDPKADVNGSLFVRYRFGDVQ
jgi:hypothetical protein